MKIIFVFLITFALFFAGISGFWYLTKKEKWSMIRLLGYSFVCALLAMALLFVIVILF
jgi:hypothetical protein